MNQKVYQHFKKVDKVLYSQIHYLDGVKLEKSSDHYRRLVRAIVGQQLSTKAAASIFNRFVHLFPDEEVKPEIIRDLKDEELRSVGLSWGKVKYLKDLSAKVLDGSLHLGKLEEMSDQEVIDELVKVKGIGQWTAEMFLMFSLARPDVFSFGDLGLKNAIKKLYGVEEVSTEYMEKLSKKWSPYRTYAAMILWESLDNKPQEKNE
jgi:DNA-3-methyladenine glycosylase II